MKERPILFNTQMVRAILDGSKTQTRRAVKGRHIPWVENILMNFLDGRWDQRPLPCGQPGDRLWVRETFFAFGYWITRFSEKKKRDEWHFVDLTLDSGQAYQFDAPDDHCLRARDNDVLPAWHRRPSIFMPQVASRIKCEVVSVRVEWLQNISDADALAEGIYPTATGLYPGSAKAAFFELWESINGAGSWVNNPLVWVIEFKKVEA